MRYSFLIDTYQTEIEKVLSLWSMFDDDDILRRPHQADRRGRNLLEQMIHQSVSENMWFSKMLGISVTDNPLPKEETRLAFMRTYAENANKRLAVLGEKDDAWWEEVTEFFDVNRNRAWVMTRRIAHTAHHRGQQAAMVRMLDYELHSTYGPTADTGGLMQNEAPVIYPYASIENLLSEEGGDRKKKPLPGPGDKPPTERLEA
ncbi:MAG: damage-inducible protein DinB [Planctomycetota bacterium]|nr:damage-inducible protein DinB [Planctomycetota bacterium]